MAGMAEEMRTLWEHEGWELPRSDGRWSSVRCFNHDDRMASARVHMDEGAYACLACGIQAGSPVKLLMVTRGWTAQQAVTYLQGIGLTLSKGGPDPVSTGPKRPWKGRRKGTESVAGWRKGKTA